MSAELRPGRRVLILVAAVALSTLAIAARLVYLQVIDGESYRLRARDQHEAQVRVEGSRGTIRDRNGRELAVSIETRSAYVHPVQISSAAEKERIVAGAASALGEPACEIRRILDNPRNSRFAFLRRRLGPRETKALQDLRIPSIGWMTDTRRYYPRGPLAAHVLGFVDIDGKGQAGVERAFDGVVRGEPTTFMSLVDARQRPLLLRTHSSGRPGSDLSLTIDEYIQHLADSELDAAMAETGAKGGTIIVMAPATGEILALANRPGFDPNNPAAVPGRNRENLGVSYGYEPGSTFKVITAGAAIEENRARPTDLVDCGMGSITIHGRRIGDHRPHATLSLAQVIAKSSNVGIIRVGLRLPARTLCDYVERFGFGRPSGIDLPSEAPGVLQIPGGRNWSGLSQAMISMGQSIVVTPLQMLTAIAAIGNDGERRTPRIVGSITRPDGTTIEPPVSPAVRVISASTARALARMMESVVDDGTGTSAAIAGYRVAGKTGTAQKVVRGAYSHSAHVASFVGFVPSQNPALAAIVVLDDPVGKYYGGDVAAPTFSSVVGPSLAYLRVPRTEPVVDRAPAEVLRVRAAERARRSARLRARILKARMEARDDEAAPLRPFPAPWPLQVTATPGLVPDLYGASLRDALTTLARSGCSPSVEGSGFVVEQAPPPGAALPGAGACSLRLSPAAPARGASRQGS